MTTVTKTYRLTRQMVAQLNVESEKRDCTPADLVRQIIADHFQRKQFESSFLAMEQRILARVDLNARMLADGIKEILDLASPEGGAR